MHLNGVLTLCFQRHGAAALHDLRELLQVDSTLKARVESGLPVIGRLRLIYRMSLEIAS